MSARILVVDDNPANLKLACDVLAWEGFEVSEARDAATALTSIALVKPDAILMDIELPGMDGLMLTRRLKANAETAGIRVIALTAYAMKGDEEKARDAGCNGYLTKPVNTRTLAHEVRLILGTEVAP